MVEGCLSFDGYRNKGPNSENAFVVGDKTKSGPDRVASSSTDEVSPTLVAGAGFDWSRLALASGLMSGLLRD